MGQATKQKQEKGDGKKMMSKLRGEPTRGERQQESNEESHDEDSSSANNQSALVVAPCLSMHVLVPSWPPVSGLPCHPSEPGHWTNKVQETSARELQLVTSMHAIRVSTRSWKASN